MQAILFVLINAMGTWVSCSQASEFTVSRTRAVAGAVSNYRIEMPNTFMNCSSTGTKCIFKIKFQIQNIYDLSNKIAATNATFDALGQTECTLSNAAAVGESTPHYTTVPATTHADHALSILTVVQNDGIITLGNKVMIECSNIANP